MTKHILIRSVFSLIILHFAFCTFNYPVRAQSPTKFDPVSIGKRVFHNPPKLVIAYPQPDITIFGDQVTVKAIVDNLVLVNPERKKKNQKGEGHLHIWLDKKNLTLKSAIEHYRVTEYNFDKVPPGKHFLIVEVVNNDHSSFEPPMKQTISFTTLDRQPNTDKQQSWPSPTTYSVNLFARYRTPSWLGIAIAFILIAAGVLLWLYERKG